MNKMLITILLTLLVSACSMFSNDQVDNTPPIAIENNESDEQVFRFPESSISNRSNEEIFQGSALPKNINFYMRGLMQNLIENLQYVSTKTPLAVTSFVFLDSNYDDASLLGNQIAESLMHEIHKSGIPVLDFKVTDYLRVTEKGDFILSRNFNELSENIPIQYIVTGNLVKHQGGYLVNARVVGIASKKVVASAQSFVPASVAKAILSTEPESNENRVPLIQGD